MQTCFTNCPVERFTSYLNYFIFSPPPKLSDCGKNLQKSAIVMKTAEEALSEACLSASWLVHSGGVRLTETVTFEEESIKPHSKRAECGEAFTDILPNSEASHKLRTKDGKPEGFLWHQHRRRERGQDRDGGEAAVPPGVSFATTGPRFGAKGCWERPASSDLLTFLQPETIRASIIYK